MKAYAILKLTVGVFLAVLPAALGVWTIPQQASAQSACNAPDPVCATREAVFIVSSFEPFASAVRIAQNRLVTNRHVVADRSIAKLTLKDGKVLTARVIPSSYEGDLALLEADGLPDGRILEAVASGYSGDLYTVAGDLSRKQVKVYPPGRLVQAPAKNHAFARVHHGAYSQPGNSGGALVDAQGRLVAIIASGGDGRFDAVPALDINLMQALTGPEHETRARDLGEALRACTERLEAWPRNPRNVQSQQARALQTDCIASANRPLYDQAAQALGRARQTDLSLELSRLAVARDPNAVTSRLSLVITMMLAQTYDQALPHVRKLIVLAPQNTSVQRFAIQIGKWGGDMELAKKGLELVRRHNPAQAEAAERFLASDRGPPPRRRR